MLGVEIFSITQPIAPLEGEQYNGPWPSLFSLFLPYDRSARTQPIQQPTSETFNEPGSHPLLRLNIVFRMSSSDTREREPTPRSQGCLPKDHRHIFEFGLYELSRRRRKRNIHQRGGSVIALTSARLWLSFCTRDGIAHVALLELAGRLSCMLTSCVLD